MNSNGWYTSDQYNSNYNNGYNAGYEAGKKAAQVKVKYITQAQFWRYNEGASVVNPTLTKGSDGVWIFDISKWTTNSAGAGTPTGWSTTYSDVITIS